MQHGGDLASAHSEQENGFITTLVKYTVKFLNFGTPEIFAIIYLKFKQTGQNLSYCVKMVQMI